MTGTDFLEAVGYVDQDLIIKTEAVRRSGKRNLPGRWAILIAAAALLLCGTAAAVGFLWNKPEVQTDLGSQTVFMSHGCIGLPDDARTAILDSVVPERDFKAFLSFDTVEDWQTFFDLPFVSAPLAAREDPLAATDPIPGSRLILEGSIDTMVSTKEADGEREPAMMWSTVSLVRYDEDGFRWSGDLDVFAAFTEEAAASGTAALIWADGAAEQIVTDYTTPSGIPCVIGQSVQNGGDQVDLCLYYGYESVLYLLRVGHFDGEADDVLEDLKEIADSLLVSYPAGS